MAWAKDPAKRAEQAANLAAGRARRAELARQRAAGTIPPASPRARKPRAQPVTPATPAAPAEPAAAATKPKRKAASRAKTSPPKRKRGFLAGLFGGG